MMIHPLHPLSTSPPARDQMAVDDAGCPPEEAPEVRSRRNAWGSSFGHSLPPPSSPSGFQTAALEGDECPGIGYGMGWSKMGFMQKMKSEDGPDHCSGPTTHVNRTMRDVIYPEDRAAITRSGGNHMARVCSDCNTTTTPLWRSGPRGPKSLCNACGIRQRKARRAMEEAAVVAGGFNPPTSVTSRISGSSKVHNKEKKPRGAGDSLLGPTSKKTTKAGGKDGLFGACSALRGTFPRDVTEAAILLMDLSCGFAHT